MTNWYDFFNVDEKTIADIQSKIQTVDEMTTAQIKDFMSQATNVMTGNLAKTGLVDFADLSGNVMKWRINTTTEVEERLLVALDAIASSNLKIQSSAETPKHLRELITRNIIAFLLDAFVGLPCEQTRTIQSIGTRVARLSENLSHLWDANDQTRAITAGSFTDIPTDIPQPTIAKMREYTMMFINADTMKASIRKSISDQMKRKFEQYIDYAADELPGANADYIDSAIYEYFAEYLTRTRDTLMTAFGAVGGDTSVVSKYYDDVLPRELYDVVSPATGSFRVATRRHTGQLEVVRPKWGGQTMIREITEEYGYDNSAWGNRLSRSLANLRYNVGQANENAIALLAFATTSFVDIPEIFENKGFVLMGVKADTPEDFTVAYAMFVANPDVINTNQNPTVPYAGETMYMTVPNEPYTSVSETVLKFQYDIYKNTNGYIYIYDRVSQKSTAAEYLAGLEEIDKNITSSNIFKFGLEDGSSIANLIVSVSRAVDKTALTIASVAKIGVQVASPVALPVAYLVGLCEFSLFELWWKLGYDDLSQMYPVPPPFGVVVSLLHPIYSAAATVKYPVLATVEKLWIVGIQLSQFISKCIRDGLYVRLLSDSNVRFLGVNFLMTPVYSSTGIIAGTQMKRVLDDKSYARLLVLYVMSARYQECEVEINAFVQDMNNGTAAFQMSQTIRDNMSARLSPAFLAAVRNNVFVMRTENYNNNFQKINNPISVPLNTIDFQYYDARSMVELRDEAEMVMRDYGIDAVISEKDIAVAIKSIRQQYENSDTFQTHIYMADTQATTHNGYFLRGVDMTDNGMLQKIQMEIDNSINGSAFMV